MCTALEKLKQDGVKEGIEKGIEIVIKALISKGFSASEISEIFDVSEEDVLRIKEGHNKSSEQL